MKDVLIGGGGPAGLAAALYAVQAGLDVVVWEPRGTVIDKACGEGLMPGALTALHDLSVDPAGHLLTGIRYVAGESTARADFRHGEGRGVRRTVLHAALRTAVLDAGIEIVRRPVTAVVQREHDVVVDGTVARYLIAADGLHSPIRRHLGLDAQPGGQRRYGLRSHVRTPAWTTYVEVHWSDTSEAYVTPVGDDLIGVALLTTVRRPFHEQLQAFPALISKLDGRDTTPVLGAGPLRQRSRHRVAGRVLLVGDASGYIDALTGEGVALALAQARAAVAAVVSGAPHQYEAAWRRATWRYRLLTMSLLSASRAMPLRRRIVPVAAALPKVFQATVNTLARPSTA